METLDSSSADPVNLRDRAESLLHMQAPALSDDIRALTPIGVKDLIHELRVHQIELEMQNEELRRSERELAGSRERYFELYDLAPVGYCTVTEKGLVQEANLTLASLIGVERRALIKQPFSRFVHPDDAGKYHLARRQILLTEEPQSYELRMVKQNGQHFYGLLGCNLTRGVDGANLCRLVLTDISQYKQAEESRMESEDKFSHMFHSSPTAMALTTLQDGRYLDVNEQFLRMIERSREQVVGMTTVEQGIFTDAAERTRFTSRIDKLRSVHNIEIEIPFGADRKLQVLWSAVVVLIGGDKCLLNSYMDITARKRTEEKMLLRGAALEAAANAIVITDRSGNLEWANSAFSTLSGWSLNEAHGKNLRDLVKSGKQDGTVYAQLWATILSGKVWSGEIINRRKDGALRTEEMTITPVRSELGDITHFIAIKQDVTDHKILESHYLKAQRMEAVGSLAAGVAHDLNNLLAPIMIINGLLKDKAPDEATRNLLSMTQTSAKRGADIIKQLLTFSRGHEGERMTVQVRHIITEMTSLIRETFPREIDIQSNVSKDLWLVRADPSQLHQILMNLCVNARDAMPEGGRLTIRGTNVTKTEADLTLPPETKPGPYISIEVLDTGQGIPEDIKHRIFEPFFTTKEPGKGTGLGLSTVFGIVKSHGGYVELVSSSEHGTMFRVNLPAIAEDTQLLMDVPIEQRPSSWKKQTIMVVDDEQFIRDSLRMVLEQEHYQVLTAPNGKEALKQYLLHQSEISLVLTDLMMPVMNGEALIRGLRTINPNLKIIAMSGVGETSKGQRLKELGVPEILMKPFVSSLLLSAVANRLQNA